ncbi:type II toxin-antitoxin system HicA family toxin [Methylomonas sp. MK1]|uniref:type II toxin-antitoxin system HicA family toxin n=1 Tax=Methylomonas sp. MK1 TaxID=1131552 RepID=UPI00037D788D|nr:type II toxin-antitoxin system HicA family toxin [Methylomonas sp. MK1]
MNAKHTKTLQAIFAKPTSATLEWQRIESLFAAIGCEVIEGRGSRVRFVFQGRIATFHRPHPSKEAKPYQVEQARDFLSSIGVRP